jgi:hydroxypyruvate isomerase
MAARPPKPETSYSSPTLSRRHWLTAAGSTAVAAAGLGQLSGQEPAAENSKLRNNIHHSVVAWCFNPMDVPTLAQHAVKLGIQSVELVPPEHWPMLKKLGLKCAIAGSHGFARGWNHRENWEFCREKIVTAVNAAADFGTQNVITFSGMLEEIDPDEGKANTIAGLKTVIGLAEKKGVNLCIEPLNTRVDENMKGHPGYQCDNIEWAVDVCNAIGSDRMKILYDIYHQQIMEGDQIVRINQFKDYIAHYHTAGVPGRKELDDTQEINYPAIMKAIVATGYQGFVGHEFIPTTDQPIASLKQAVQVCDV